MAEHKTQRILLMRLGAFGDVVFTLPAVHLVKSVFPKARISYLVYREFATLLAGFPGIDEVVTIDRERYRRLNPATILSDTCTLLRRLAGGRFELVIDLQGFGETGLLSWLTRAPRRWGLVYKRSRGWAYTRPVMKNPQLHPIEGYLQVLREAGGLDREGICNEFVVPQATLEEARTFYLNRKLELNRPTLFIQPFTSTPHKDWKLEHYLTEARHWISSGMQVVFGGGPKDQAALDAARQEGFVVAAGSSAVLSAGLVKLATVIVGGDTGLLHLAAAMNKPVVMIMGSLRPGACYPFGQRERVILPPAGSPVAAVTPSAVRAACARALAEVAGGRTSAPSMTVLPLHG